MNAPLEMVLTVSRNRSSSRVSGTVMLAFVFHISAGMAAASMHRTKVSTPAPLQEIIAIAEEPPPPPAPTTPEPEEAKTPPTPAAPVIARAAAPIVQTNSAPAAAANVLTAPDDGPADLTDGMVVGSAETYAGGTTSPTGTGTQPGGAPRGIGTPAPIASNPPPMAPTKDQSRAARLAEGMSWNCPFPSEADEEGIDDAVVSLAIDVDRNGGVSNVLVVGDPGHGFGRVAASCARAKRFSAALDVEGQPKASQARVNVKFHR